ncbi:hypothetical protein ACQ4PT_027632 [Festuca glaucescens]
MLIEPLKEGDDPATVPFKQARLLEECWRKDALKQLRNEEDPMGTRNVRVRLDCVVACPEWSKLFPDAMVHHLVSSRSDHCPILVTLKEEEMNKNRRKPDPSYEVIWERDESLFELINEAWSHHAPATNLTDIREKLKATMASMTSWNNNVFGSVNKEIKQLRKKLEILQSNNYLANQGEIRKISARLDELLLREEIMWRQRSRIEWLKEGDRNTKYFHRKALGRKKKNKILKLKRSDSTFETDEEEITNMTHLFFDALYTEDLGVDPSAILDVIDPAVTEEINEYLTAEFTDEEIANALFQIGPHKAPGPDGLSARFFQRNWSLLRS